MSEDRTRLPTIGLGTGLWISPDRVVIALKGSHIEEIIAWPDRFGLSSAEIKRAYAYFGERMPVEGQARHHIIRAVLGLGWIRLRHQKNYWSITVDCLETRRPMLEALFLALRSSEKVGLYEDLRVYDLSVERERVLEVKDLINEADPSTLPVLRAGTTGDAAPITGAKASLDLPDGGQPQPGQDQENGQKPL